jgi:hypothetical protein
MHKGHRRLKEAFEKTRVVEDSLVESSKESHSLTDQEQPSASSFSAQFSADVVEERDKQLEVSSFLRV